MSATLLSNYFTPDQLAIELGTCTKTLDRWRALGEGPPITKIGRRTFYAREAVETWLKSRQEKQRKRA